MDKRKGFTWFDLLGAVHTKTANGKPETVKHNGQAMELLAELKDKFVVEEIDANKFQNEFRGAARMLALLKKDDDPLPKLIYRIRKKHHRYTAGYLCLKADFAQKESM